MAPSDSSTFFSSPFAVCVSAKAVYGWFKNGNPQATDAGHETWGKVSGLQAEIGTLINKAVTDSGAMWGGAAGDAMRSSTSPMATWADLTGTSAQSGSDAVAEISSAFRAAQNSVQEPVEVPDKPWYNDFSPWDTDYDDAVDKSQGVDEANMRVINAYADRTNYATSNMPTFEAPADSTAEIDDGTTPPPPPPKSINELGQNPHFTTNQNTSSTSNNNTVGSNEHVSSFDPPGTGDPSQTGGPGKDGDTNTSGNDDGTTKPSEVNDPNRPPVGTPTRPPVGTPGGIGDPAVGGLPFGPNDPRNPANKLGGGPGGPGGGRGGGGTGGGGGGSSRGGLGGGLGGGAGAGGIGKGGFGPGGAAAAAGQFGGAAGEGAGRAGAGGFGPGGAAGAGGRGAAGAGAGGMGGGHGAKGEGGDDLEHSSKYLQPSDEYFGDGTMVAPPVIGG